MIGNRLAHERRGLGLSQAAFAPYLGIGRSSLAMIETDRAQLDVASLIDLAKKVGIDPIYVLTGEPGRVAASKLLDWDLVLAIQSGIHAWCSERKIDLTPEKQTLVLKILYERFSKSDCDIREGLNEALQLAA
jgi:transcriptional regulator with XRE-family HTH domain